MTEDELAPYCVEESKLVDVVRSKYKYVKFMFNKRDLSEKLNVSYATICNWLKTNNIEQPDVDKFYSEELFNKIVDDVKRNPKRLMSRANRSLSSSNFMTYLGIKDSQRKQLLDDVVKTHQKSKLPIEDSVIALCIAFLKSNNLFSENRVSQLLREKIKKSKFSNDELESCYSQFELKNSDDDFLGAFYQSIVCIANKAARGSYYTPPGLLKNIKVSPNKTVLDPCCGSGGILLRILSKKHNPSLIFARDVDDIALLICYVNLVLFFNDGNITPSIIHEDILQPETNDLFRCVAEKYDYVVTNPPWGSKFSEKEKKILLENYPILDTSESSSIALFNALNKIEKNGKLFFFLPESLLNVAMHRNIRRYLLSQNFDLKITRFGNAFKGVQTKCFLLEVTLVSSKRDRIEIVENEVSCQFAIADIIAPDYVIPVSVNDADSVIINQIYSQKCVKLSSNTTFALGIVTGNNKKYVLSEQCDDSEPIYKGKDIEPYKLDKPSSFICFNPGAYQQIASEEYYRSKKIVYRFISNKIVCALIDDGSLILNSANLLISKDYPMEILVCFLNSCIYTFIYQKKFNSNKVLKSHLLNMPFPIIDDQERLNLLELYKRIMNGENLQSECDMFLCNYFGLTPKQYEYIKSCCA